MGSRVLQRQQRQQQHYFTSTTITWLNTTETFRLQFLANDSITPNDVTSLRRHCLCVWQLQISLGSRRIVWIAFADWVFCSRGMPPQTPSLLLCCVFCLRVTTSLHHVIVVVRFSSFLPSLFSMHFSQRWWWLASVFNRVIISFRLDGTVVTSSACLPSRDVERTYVTSDVSDDAGDIVAHRATTWSIGRCF